jgi:hypothetical protein
LTDRARVEVERLELSASRALSRAEGTELDGRVIVRSRAWHAVEEVITKALEPYPDAMLAVAQALDAHAAGKAA